MQILVLADIVTPRVKYILDHILGEMLGFSVITTTLPDDLLIFDGPIINYSHFKVNHAVCITPHQLITSNGVSEQDLLFFNWRSKLAFFQTNSDFEIPFDIFAASFYLITRYEEYLPSKLDDHSRFCEQNSIAYKNGFLEIPLVDLWVKELGDIIKNKFPKAVIKTKHFRFIPTIDIDNAFAYKHKGFYRSTMGAANALLRFRFKDFYRRCKVCLNLWDDPYNTYKDLFEIMKSQPNTIWFILGGKYGAYDKHIPIKSKAMQALVKSIGEKFSIGIHPSYESGISAERFSEEISDLSKAYAANIFRSRQHYLRIQLPQTYRLLSAFGITEDYSMGYSTSCGFRASTCTPFNFYDLIHEKALPLKVVPFQVMDRALLNEFKLDSANAVKKSLEIAKRVKAVGGTFVIAWHNETLSGINEWEGWKETLGVLVEKVEAIL